ncbi:putative aspartic-type endopeptidase OPSB 2 [Colletotrichum chlorophyti]|uniref:Putative aspartic-type endopeptidase OPSB 2 n=1 Tax=Colletotrichum chlorophyti TaxID=708187 RepID=A0A1Q8S4M2_9PEZI|nr:putative aspartic-type endopeptidase OPSB 2 [Colletotrichum chlorophyti]
MKLSGILAIAALSTKIASQKVVSASFHRVEFPPDLVQITRRDVLDLTAINNITGGGYYAEVEVGTPGQKALLHIDTGSSDTWVIDRGADLCTTRYLQAEYGTGCTATFDTRASSTYKLVSAYGFHITYLDRRTIRGNYISDSVAFGGKTISNQQLGLALETDTGSGLMGLGFSEGVSSQQQYPTILDNMVSQGHIGRKAFSLWLNDLSSSEGTLLFGGIDTEKYIGSLTTLPLVSDFQTGNITSYSVAMTGLSVEGPDGNMVELASEDFNASTVLDSGSTVCLLPERLTHQIWLQYEVIDAGYGYIDCKWKEAKGADHYIDFEFDGVTIRVPLEEMVLDNLAPIMDEIRELFPWERPCMFGVQNSAYFNIKSSRFALLGDTFLRSAYVVYDEANRQVAIAQANLNSTRSNIIELRANETALPTATGVAFQISTPAPTRTAGGGGGTTSTGLVTPTPTDVGSGASHRDAAFTGINGFLLVVLNSLIAVVGATLI